MLRSPRRSSRLRCGRAGGRETASACSAGIRCAGVDGVFAKGCSKLSSFRFGEAGVSYGFGGNDTADAMPACSRWITGMRPVGESCIPAAITVTRMVSSSV